MEQRSALPVGDRQRKTRRQRLVVALTALAIVIIASYPAIAAVLSRAEYGTFAFWKIPERINYCGRRFYLSGTVGGTPESLMASVVGAPRWETVGHTFWLRPVEAPVSQNRDRGTVCSMAVYVPTGHQRYAEYDLSGGP